MSDLADKMRAMPLVEGEDYYESLLSLCMDEVIEALHKVITDERGAVDPEWPVSAARVESFEYGVNMSIQSIEKLKQ